LAIRIRLNIAMMNPAGRPVGFAALPRKCQ
jgi:hypothetical protein